MINFPSEQEIAELESIRGQWCVTLYVPYIKPSARSNPNRIELKNVLKKTEDILLSKGMEPKEIRKTIGPGLKLVQDTTFWPKHQDNLLLFMYPGFFRYYAVPDLGYRMLTIGSEFNLDLMLEAIHQDQTYYVLFLNHNNVRLFQGDRDILKPVKLKNMPSNMKKELNIDGYPKWRETHVIAPVSRGKGSEASHGQYNVRQTDKIMLKEFFRRIDKRLHTYLTSQHDPLIIAGVGYLLPIYRQVNTYPHLKGSTLKGNFEHTNEATLGKRLWPLIAKASK